MKCTKIIKRISRALRRLLLRGFDSLGILQDRIMFRDSLVITMRREDGSIYRQWEEKCNTWVTAGLTLIRDALDSGGFTAIGYMYQNGGEGSATMSTANSTPASNKARFISTWIAAGAITGITQFAIRQTSGGSNLSEVSVASFNKPDGISLEITWDTTIS